MASWLFCCQGALKDALKGVSCLTALGGLACLLGGVHALLPLGATAADPSIAWFAWVMCVVGGLLLALGMAAATASWCSLTAPMHCYTGATLALLPLQVLVVWAYVEHPSELRRLADRDQTYTLQAILAWTDAHSSLAAGLAGLWLVLQAAAAVLGSAYACCPARQRHPWDRYWAGEDDGREPLLPQRQRNEPAGPQSDSPQAAGYRTPPSRFQSPYTSPARPPASFPLPAPPMAVGANKRFDGSSPA